MKQLTCLIALILSLNVFAESWQDDGPPPRKPEKEFDYVRPHSTPNPSDEDWLECQDEYYESGGLSGWLRDTWGRIVGGGNGCR